MMFHNLDAIELPIIKSKTLPNLGERILVFECNPKLNVGYSGHHCFAQSRSPVSPVFHIIVSHCRTNHGKKLDWVLLFQNNSIISLYLRSNSGQFKICVPQVKSLCSC